MDTTLPQKFPFILDRNLAKANCTENHVCTSCDTVVLGLVLSSRDYLNIEGGSLHANMVLSRPYTSNFKFLIKRLSQLR